MSNLTYKKAWVDIEKWDLSSKIAYDYAVSTFSARKWMIWEPVTDNWWFTGLMDMWDFYLTQCDDWVGTKIAIAESIWKFDTLWYDLLAMVCDDNICIWAETISITNTLDTNKIDSKNVESMMQWLAQACIEQKIVIPWWEIAELWKLVNWNTWNATAVWVVTKDKLISWKNIKTWDKIISLYEPWFRSNWFSLIRYILENKFGNDVYNQKCSFSNKTWWEEILLSSTIYSWAILNIIWRFWNETTQYCLIKWISHITWWWIPWNLNRILKQSWLWANLDSLWKPSKIVTEIQKLWNIDDSEAYKSWNMCNWMMIICDSNNCDVIIKSLNKDWIQAQVAGEIINEKKIELKTEYWKVLGFDI